MSSNGELINAENLQFQIDNTAIVNGIDLNLGMRDALIIVGLSGSGKSTLIKMCGGLLMPTYGTVSIMGEDIYKMSYSKRLKFLSFNVGFVFQDGALINNLNVFDNLALPLRYHSMCREKAIKEKIQEIAVDLGFERTLYMTPPRLSLGQQKLIGFARNMLMNPEITLFDEPTSSLDMESARLVTNKIRDYIILGGSVIAITHDLFFANSLANKLGVIDDGKMIAFGNPSDVKSMKNKKVRKIIKSVSDEADLADELLKLMK